MRRIKNNRDVYKNILNKKLLINFIVLFFIVELLIIPFTVASITTSDNLGCDSKTSDSGSLPAVGDAPSGSDSGTMEKDDTSTSSDSETMSNDDTSSDTSDGSTVVDDTQTDTNSDSTSVDTSPTNTVDSSYNTNDKTSDSSDSNLIMDNKTVDSSSITLLDDIYDYAPNERTVTTDEIVSKTENIIGDLTSGIETEVKLGSSADINSVTLTTSTDIEEVKVTVIKLKDKPEEIIDPPKKNVSIYKYLDIKLSSNNTFIDEEEISSLNFNFKVEKTWIANNEIDKYTVILIRYHDGVWQNLSTTLTSENETFISYTAASPGFSTFAVVGSKVIEKSESYGSDDVSIPWSIIIAFIMALTIMLVFILFKARYIYLKEENK